MIWIKEKDKIIGYIPMLSKKYSEDEIRKMSENHCYEGWSTLSELVMRIQGINYSYNGGASYKYIVEAPKTLAEVTCSFEFECFLLPSDTRIESYVSDIYNVFENLTLYKVECYSESQLKDKIESLKKDLSYFITEKTIRTIDFDFKQTLSLAEKNEQCLKRLLKVFSNNHLKLSHEIFQDADDAVIKKAYKKRRITKERLSKSIYN